MADVESTVENRGRDGCEPRWNHLFGRSRGQYLFKVEKICGSPIGQHGFRMISLIPKHHEIWVVLSPSTNMLKNKFRWGWTHRSWKLKGLKDDFPCRRMPLDFPNDCRGRTSKDFSPHGIIQPNASGFLMHRKILSRICRGLCCLFTVFFLQILESQSLF